MPPQRSRRNSASSGKPKLFQCKGYGDCSMVFTRSEHLTRHARKHTGEKPFKCIVPECNKKFSRFDNMMQHTQTHRTHQSPPATRQRRSRRRQNSLSVNNSCLSLQTGEADHSNKAGSRTPPVALNNCRGRSPKRNPRRLSIAYLCNPVVEPLSSLTKDELEALQALSHLQSFTKQAYSHHHHPCACL